MIEKVLARDLMFLVNSPEQFGLLQEYVKYRIDFLHTQLEQSEDPFNTRKLQGAIRELKLFFTLRDEVLKDSEK